MTNDTVLENRNVTRLGFRLISYIGQYAEDAQKRPPMVAPGSAGALKTDMKRSSMYGKGKSVSTNSSS